MKDEDGACVLLQVPQGTSKYDPLKKVITAEAPAGRGAIDPLGGLLDIFMRKANGSTAQVSALSVRRSATAQRPISCQYDAVSFALDLVGDCSTLHL